LLPKQPDLVQSVTLARNAADAIAKSKSSQTLRMTQEEALARGRLNWRLRRRASAGARSAGPVADESTPVVAGSSRAGIGRSRTSLLPLRLPSRADHRICR